MDSPPHNASHPHHGHHDHHGHHVHAPVAFAPAFPGTALVLGVGGRVALAGGAAAVLWLTVGWALT